DGPTVRVASHLVKEGTTLSRSQHEASSVLRLLSRIAPIVVLLVAAAPGHAAKWRHCPDQLGYYPSHIGAVGAPFIHPGRELAIFLSGPEQRSTGGFSTALDGNTVHVTFASLFGSPIELPPFTAAAVSPATLYFTFPDTSTIPGGPLAGPVAVTVTTGARITADLLGRHQVQLPPSNADGELV